MNHFLVDSNIIIYSLNGDAQALQLLEAYKEATLHMSIISWIETLTGSLYHEQTIDEIAQQIDYFNKLPVSDSVGRMAAYIMQKQARQRKKQRFQDSIIAATAIVHRMPLLTNNPRDFRAIRGLKIISPKSRSS
jgi:predicted nucleic acid-binding protein